MRAPDEKPDVTRGAGYQLAADAKLINPELTLDMLYWSEPRWVTDAEDVYAARYEWHKRTLDAAYETYGLEFDYVSAVRNEREIDPEWIKYLSKSLKAEKDCPYDYATIKIVAADEVCTWKIAELMLEKRNYTIESDAFEKLLDITDVKRKAPNFANAREIRNILDQVIMCQNLRCLGTDDRTLALVDVNSYIKDSKILLFIGNDARLY